MDIEDIYADLATVWHWQPRDMDQMYYDELLMWRTKAAERTQSEEGGEI